MDPDLEIFLQTPENASPEEISAYLDEACGDDAELRSRVEALFAADQVEEGIVDQAPKISDSSAPLEAEGNVIHNYKLLQKIGEGGFGDVYMAEQFQPVKRRVALKIIKLGMDTKQVVARFEAERQALAMMDHPNIAKVHDGGSTELGRPYFVMELVRGIPITKFCDEQNLDTKDRLALFIDVCHAVQHAHQKGVIHRDLKPSNVMVTMHDDKPVVKVIDFGVAKATQTDLTDKTLFTKFDQFIGTPAYMSPEQAQFSGLDIYTRSDIYTLGVLLYELLTGGTPFDSKQMLTAGYDEIRRIIKEDEPELPSSRLSTFGKAELTSLAKNRSTAPARLPSQVKGDLDWIVMKAIEKDRTRRYDTANALAADIGRHLEDEPVLAAAPSTVYRAKKYLNKHRALLTTAAVVITCLLVGTTVSIVLALRAITAENTAEDALVIKDKALIRAEEALDRAYPATTRAAHRNLQDGELGPARSDLDLFRPTKGERDRRGWEWYYASSLIDQSIEAISADQGVLHAVAYSPRGKQIATAGATGTIKIWDAKSRTQSRLMNEHKAPVLALAWKPGDENQLASAGEDNTAIIWEVESGSVKTRLSGHLDRVQAIAWHPVLPLLATAGADGRVLIWNPENDSKLHVLNSAVSILSLTWTEDGSSLLAGLDDPNDNGRIMVWKLEANASDSATLKFSEAREIKTHGHGDGNSITTVPGTSWIAVGSDQKFLVYDLENDTELTDLQSHGDTINSIAWHPDKSVAVTASNDGLIKIWHDSDKTDPGVMQHTHDLLGHRGAVNSVSWSPDGAHLISAGQDGMIRFWDPRNHSEARPIFEAENWIAQASWSPDGEKLAVSYWMEEALILDSSSGQELGKLTGAHSDKICRISWSPSGDRLATPSKDGTVVIWDAKNLGVIHILEHSESMESAWWSPDGNWLACGTWYWNPRSGADHDKVTMWDLRGEVPKRAFVFGEEPDSENGAYEKICRFSWHPDGKLIATAGRLGGVKLWNQKGDLLGVIRESAPKGSHHRNEPTALAWSRHGDHLAMAIDKGALVLFEKPSGKADLQLVYEQDSRTGSNINRLIWSPDSTRIALSRRDGIITLHEAASGQYLIKLDHAAAGQQSAQNTFQFVFALDWSPDGKKIASGGADQVVRIWDATKGYELEERLSSRR